MPLKHARRIVRPLALPDRDHSGHFRGKVKPAYAREEREMTYHLKNPSSRSSSSLMGVHEPL